LRGRLEAEQSNLLLVQDPRRYFEQTSTAGAGPVPVSSTSQPSDGLSTLDVLRAINPHALQSGMDSAAATQVSNMISVWPQLAVETFNRRRFCTLTDQALSWFAECLGSQLTVLISPVEEMCNAGTWHMCSLFCYVTC